MRSLALAILLLLGCSGSSRHPAAAASGAADGAPPRPTFAHCTRAGALPPTAGSFRHQRSRLTRAVGAAAHQAEDVIAAPGSTPDLTVHLAYGTLAKDLEDEDVAAFLDTCNGWLPLGTARSNDDGLARFSAPALPAGEYAVHFVVPGDGSRTSARLWLVPAGTHVVVTDIDGTLTTSDLELMRDLWRDLTGRSYQERAYAGAAALTRAHAARGHLVVYLTGRPTLLAAHTRSWLAAGDFAPGILVLSRSLETAIPDDEHIGAFKRAQLDRLRAGGLVIDAAYGNAATDVRAYLAAGLPPATIHIIGKHGGGGGTQAVTPDWRAHAGAVAGGPPVAQPFD